MILGVNYAIYGCSSERTNPGVLYRSLTLEENIFAAINHTGWYMTIWNSKLKTELCVLVDYSY